MIKAVIEPEKSKTVSNQTEIKN